MYIYDIDIDSWHEPNVKILVINNIQGRSLKSRSELETTSMKLWCKGVTRGRLMCQIEADGRTGLRWGSDRGLTCWRLSANVKSGFSFHRMSNDQITWHCAAPMDGNQSQKGNWNLKMPSNSSSSKIGLERMSFDTILSQIKAYTTIHIMQWSKIICNAMNPNS